jgi:hypothetical protein
MNKAALLAVILAASLPGAAEASSVHPRDCVMNVGPDQVTFTAFQQRRTHDTFCSHLPDAGPTVLILDTEQGELRDMLVEIRILRDVGQQDWRENLEANTVYFLQSKKYFSGKGTFSFDYDFGADGHYIALVKAVSEDGAREYTGQFFFSVGETVVFYLSLGTILSAFCFLAFGIWRKDVKPSARAGKAVAIPEHFGGPGRRTGGDEFRPSPIQEVRSSATDQS